MGKVSLIIKREYLTRVKKMSFVVMTLVGPLLMASLMIVPIWLSIKDKDIQIVEVIDETGMFANQIKSTSELKFESIQNRTIEEAKQVFYDEKYTSILHITSAEKESEVKMYYKKQPGISTIGHIRTSLERAIKNVQLKSKFNISQEDLAIIQPKVEVKTFFRDINGEEKLKSTAKSTALGLGGAILIYMFIFMYGVQVMRGVIEEKTSRIVEIIISSVKPFQLMMGKIIGIALVGLTQFLLWTILTGTIVMAAQSFIQKGMNTQGITNQIITEQVGSNNDTQKMVMDISSVMGDIPITKLLLSFLFYFMGGYLLYGALFAAVGSAVDSEADTQQFMMPITIPLIFGIFMAQSVIENPDGTLAFWMSMIPFTSPIVMMVRIPFGVEIWELLLSMTLLVLGFLFTTWMAGKIYRTGILMYGKKASYKELFKWLFYKG